MNRAFLLLFTAIFVFVACEGPEGPPGRDGGGLYIQSYDYEIFEDDWEYVDDGTYKPGEEGYNPSYFCEVSVPELTRNIFNNGFVAVYMYRDPDNKEGAGYIPLADSYPYEDPDYILDYVWTEHYSYICLPGRISFTVANSDFIGVEAGDWTPPRQVFRVVLIN